MTTARSTILVASLVLLAGCTATPAAGDGGAPEDAAPDNCQPDTACPDGAPVWGGPCTGTLSCPYASMCGAGSEDGYTCVDGSWSLTSPAPCAGGMPPLSESCRTPFAGTIDGASIVITEDRAGAPPLVDGDTIELTVGAQGLTMIPYRVRVEGTDVPPTCVSVSALASLEGVSATRTTHAARLRCGGSLRIQDILPDNPCDPRVYAVSIDVTVLGVGQRSVSLMAMGGNCTFGR